MSREELHNKKQEATHQYQIVMQAHEKVSHQLAEINNSIAKVLWSTKKKRLVAEAFPHGHDSE